MTTLPPELIEKLRQTGIRLDRNGAFWHEGGEITHERFRMALLRWLDLREDGRPILRLDDKRYAYVEVEDAMLLVLSVQREGESIMLQLNDGSREELSYQTLRQKSDNSLYCRVRGAKLLARFQTSAYLQLAEFLREREDGVFVLPMAGQEFPIQPFEEAPQL